MYTSMIEEEFRPPEGVTNILVPGKFVVAYNQFGRVKGYDTNPELLERAYDIARGKIGVDGVVLGNVDIPDDTIARLIAEGEQLVCARRDERAVGRTIRDSEARMAVIIAELKGSLQPQ